MELHGIAAVAPTALSLVLYGVIASAHAAATLRGARRRRRRPVMRSPGATPHVSILKPLAGLDDELAENLASFAAIDHASFEILFGIASPGDPAAPVARAFLRAHPHVRARLVVTAGPDPGTPNPKVAPVAGLARPTRGEVLVVSDSNVRGGPSHLHDLCDELAAPGVGLVSSVVAGTGERTLGAALENLQLGAAIAPGIVACALLAGHGLTVGKSMALRRRDLEALGGFERVGAVLAEDFVLGRAFAQAGHRVRVSTAAVENRNVACSIARTLERHTRWAKMRRAITPAGFALEPLLCPVLVASFALAATRSREAAAALVAAALVQTAGALLAMRVTRGAWLRPWLAPLEIVRSYLLFLCWLRACASRRVRWRGHDLLLGPDSAIAFATAREGADAIAA